MELCAAHDMCLAQPRTAEKIFTLCLILLSLLRPGVFHFPGSLSYFARITYKGESPRKTFLRSVLFAAHRRQGIRLNAIRLIDVVDLPSNETFDVYYEIFVSDLPPIAPGMVNIPNFQGSRIQLHDNPYDKFVLSPTWELFYGTPDKPPDCDEWHDRRRWIVHSERGTSEMKFLATNILQNDPNRVATYDLRNDGIYTSGLKSRKVFSSVTADGDIYAMEQDYILSCKNASGKTFSHEYASYRSTNFTTKRSFVIFSTEYDVTSDCNIIQYFIDPPIGNNPVPYFFRVKAKIPILPNARQYIWILKEIPSNQEVYSYTSTVGFADSTPEVEFLVPNLYRDRTYSAEFGVSFWKPDGTFSVRRRYSFPFMTVPPLAVQDLCIYKVWLTSYTMIWSKPCLTNTYAVYVDDATSPRFVTSKNTYSSYYVPTETISLHVKSRSTFGESPASASRQIPFWHINSTRTELTVTWEPVQLPLTASSYEVSVISPYSTITNRTNGTDITMELTVVSDIYYVLVQLVNGKNQLDLYFNVSHNSFCRPPYDIEHQFLPRARIRFSWTSDCESAENFVVRIQQVKPLFPFQTFTIPANETFFVFDADDICGGAEFSVNVKSVNLAGESEAATSSLQAALNDAINDLQVISATDSSIRLSLMENKCVGRYVAIANSSLMTFAFYFVDVQNQTLTGLPAGTEFSIFYFFQYNTNGAMGENMTIEAATAASNPTEYSSRVDRSGVLKISWTPTVRATEYRVFENTTRGVVYFDTVGTTISIAGYNGASGLFFYIATKSTIVDNYLVTINYHNLTTIDGLSVCPPPENVQHSFQSNETVISWSNPCLTAETFTVRVLRENPFGLLQRFTDIPANQTYIIIYTNDVCGGVILRIQVRAVNSKGSSKIGRHSFETAIRGEINNLKVIGATENTISLSVTEIKCLGRYVVIAESSSQTYAFSFIWFHNQTLTGLPSGTYFDIFYFFQVYTGGIGKKETITAATAAANPTKLNVDLSIPNTVHVTWNSTVRASRYRVFVAGPQGLLYIADTVDKMINIPSLALGIRINIFLATKSWIHPGFIIFNYNNLPTTTFASVCPPLQNIQHSFEKSGVRLTWTTTCSTSKSTTIEILHFGSPLTRFFGIRNDYLIVSVLDDLCGGANITILAWSVNEAGESQPATYSFETRKTLKINNLRVIGATDSSIHLSIHLSITKNKCLGRYVAIARTRYLAIVFYFIHPFNQTLSGLDSGTQFTIFYFFQYVGGAVGANVTIRAATSAPNPLRLSLNVLSMLSSRIEWIGTSRANRYRVFVNSSGEPDYFVESADTMIILTDLVHGSFYKVSLATQSTIVFRQLDIINYHNQPTIEFYTACPRPDNVKHTIRGNIINVTWSSSCSLVESFWVEINNHGVLFRNFSNLTPSTTYLVFDIDICGEIKLSISVRAVNKAGSSRPGNLSIEIDIQPSINDFKAIAATDSSIHLSVQRSDCIERYVAIAKSPTLAYAFYFIHPNNLTLYGLPSATVFEIEFRARFRKRDVPLRKTIQVATAASNPTRMNIENVSPKAIVVAWLDKPTTEGYRIFVRDPARLVYIIDTIDARVTLRNLAPGVLHKVNVAAKSTVVDNILYTINHNYKNSPTLQFTSVARNPPVINVVNATTSTAGIRWAFQTGAARYRVIVNDNGTQRTQSSHRGYETSAVIGGLQYGRTYNISIVTTTRVLGVIGAPPIVFENPISTSIIIKAAAKNPKPLEIMYATYDSVLIEWTPQTNALQYRVVRSSRISGIKEANVTESKYNITGITDNDFHNITVASITKLHPDIPLFVNKISPSLARVRKATPTEFPIIVTRVTHSYSSFRWNAQPNADVYRVLITHDGKVRFNILYNKLYIQVRDLPTGKESRVDVSAVTNATATVDISVVLAPPLRITTAAPNPRTIQITKLTINSVSLRWELHNGAAYYSVSIGLQGSTSQTTQNPPNVNTRSYNDLSPGKIYNVSVRAISVVQPSSTVYVNTHQVPSIIVATITLAPKELTAVVFANRRLSLRWTPPEGAVGYIVKIQAKVNSYAFPLKELKTRAAQFEVFTLEELATHFSITVQAINSLGYLSVDSEVLELNRAIDEKRKNDELDTWKLAVAVGIGCFILLATAITVAIAFRKSPAILIINPEQQDAAPLFDDAYEKTFSSGYDTTRDEFHSSRNLLRTRN